MGLKYNLTHYDDKNNENVVYIYDDSYTDAIINIDGYAVLKSGKIEDVSSIFKGIGLQLNIQANTSLTFSEFFESEERTFKVIYKRNSDTLFVGWIEPEGYYESFISDTWFVQVNCLDGLSYLENLSYVQSNGLIWTGKQTGLEVIVNALERTGLNLKIYTNIDIYYTGLDETLDVLDNIYFNSERYYRDDGETIMSCEDVLKDLLQIFGASIIQHRGVWYIYKINQIYSDTSPIFFAYNSDGTLTGPVYWVSPDTLKTIGSQINDFPLFHCNSNQKIGLEKAISSLRVYYKYGFTQSQIENAFLINTGGAPDGWTILKPASYSVSGAPRYVITINSGGGDAVLGNTDGSDIITGQSLRIFIRTGAPSSSGAMRLSVTLSGGSDYSIDNNLEWQTGLSEVITQNLAQNSPSLPPGSNEYTFIIPPAPIDGTVKFRFNEGTVNYVPIEISLFLNEETTGNNLKGEVWTFENEDISTSKVAENIEVYNGDAFTDFFIGNIYEADASTQTLTWNRKGGSEELPILHLLGQDLMRLRQGNSLIFSGDVKGFIDYFSVIQIDGFDGLFSIISYSYLAKEDITTLELKRFYGDPITSLNIGDSPVLDYGNTVKPTIKG